MKIRIVLCCAAAAAMSGCIELKPSPDPTLYFLLDGPSAPSAAPDAAGLRVGLLDVRVPGFLRQTPMTVRRGEHELVPVRFHRWAQPFGGMVTQALATALQAQEGVAVVTQQPWSSVLVRERTVQVRIQDFSGRDDGQVVLLADWQVETLDSDPPVFRDNRGRFEGTWTPSDYPGLVRTMNALVVELAGAIRRDL